ncbi:YcnI family copper-binding membrane protein [Polycladomyces subterraneus]|uniref:YcnI family protein n=1 Tax=Polycladomyces subterraneus TaxID=1016997 RepID=A0ABT8IJL9_9BACL|nr:YcnI family protein [Polycladomyces subterraneus]MDN4592364.1 YcnI family protein [Polycladomyces subterraneus]
MKKITKWIAVLLFAGSILTFTTVAEAHVTVWPKQSITGTWEKYTVRVPSEKNVNTTKVRLEFPQGVQVESVMPVSGWNYQFEKGKDGKDIALIWTATNGGIKPHEFMEFSFVAQNPKTKGTIAWRADQTYADGSVVHWTGAPDSDTPASVTAIKTSDQANSTGTMQHEPMVSNHTTVATSSSSSTLNIISIVLAGLAFVLSLISFFRKKPNA